MKVTTVEFFLDSVLCLGVKTGQFSVRCEKNLLATIALRTNSLKKV